MPENSWRTLFLSGTVSGPGPSPWPWSIHFWYTLSVDGRRVSEGFSDRLDYAAATGTGKPYLLRIQYIRGGEVRREEKHSSFRL